MMHNTQERILDMAGEHYNLPGNSETIMKNINNDCL
jgi:hypothetical protein